MPEPYTTFVQIRALPAGHCLRVGATGVRELRRTAQALGVTDAAAAVLVEVACAAGLVADDGETDPRWAPTPAFDDWLATTTGARWATLEAFGATAQRPLWASTSTKDPAHSDILYVQELIGPDTVNTMPLATMDAFRDHGVPAETVTAGVDEAAAHLAELRALGIDMFEVAGALEREGVRAFVDSHEALLVALEEKRRTYLAKGW